MRRPLDANPLAFDGGIARHCGDRLAQLPRRHRRRSRKPRRVHCQPIGLRDDPLGPRIEHDGVRAGVGDDHPAIQPVEHAREPG